MRSVRKDIALAFQMLRGRTRSDQPRSERWRWIMKKLSIVKLEKRLAPRYIPF
jgi:hypothetical protein